MAARRVIRNSIAAPSTSSTSCPRSRSRWWWPMTWLRLWSRRFKTQPAPARSGMAKSSSPASKTLSVSARAKPAPRPSRPAAASRGGRFQFPVQDLLPMSAAAKILQETKAKDVQYVDLRFTDTRARVHHVTFDIGLVDEDFLDDGTMFAGSSIAGWETFNES